MVSVPSLTICIGLSMPAFLIASNRKKTSSVPSSAMRIVFRLAVIGGSAAIAREKWKMGRVQTESKGYRRKCLQTEWKVGMMEYCPDSLKGLQTEQIREQSR